MNSMIDRYLYDVSRRLPEDIRTDVERELRSNIEDMLSEEPDEAEIEKVLSDLGSPGKLAVKYHPHPRYLISPEIFDDYVTVLKIVAITLSSLLAAFAVFKIIFGDTDAGAIATVVSVITSILTGVFTGIIQAFFWVTIVFFLVEYYGNKKDWRPWSPKNLPEIPSNAKYIIKPSESIAGTIFTVLFSALFLVGTLRHPPFIAWYEVGGPTAPLFTVSVVQRFLPLYLFMIGLALFVMAIKLLKGRWTVGVAISQSLYNVFNAVIGVAFISHPDIFTDAFITRFAEKLNVTAAVMDGYFEIGVTVIIVLIILGAVGDIISAVNKTMKSYK